MLMVHNQKVSASNEVKRPFVKNMPPKNSREISLQRFENDEVIIAETMIGRATRRKQENFGTLRPLIKL